MWTVVVRVKHEHQEDTWLTYGPFDWKRAAQQWAQTNVHGEYHIAAHSSGRL
jgi:hypothetical protein